MMVSLGALAATALCLAVPPPPLFCEALLLHPLTASPVTATSEIAAVMSRLFMWFLSVREGRTAETGMGSDPGITGHLRRPPAQQPLLERGDQGLGDQGDDADDDHPGEHAVRGEVVLGV